MTRSTGPESPASFAGDETFIQFCQEADSVVGGRHYSEPPPGVLRLTEQLASSWRMPDDRFMQVQPDAMYGSYLLYLNESGTLNVVLDVFLPGQAAVIHNHLCWCSFVCLSGDERERLYEVPEDLSGPPREIDDRICPPGQVRGLADARNLFHQVECASDEPTVSLHIYGNDIGSLTRDMWDADRGEFVKFSSGYSNEAVGVPEYYKT